MAKRRLDELGKWVSEFAEYSGMWESKVRKVVDEMLAEGKTVLDPDEVYRRLGGETLYGPATEYVPPTAAPAPPAPEMSLAQKVGSDPNARGEVARRMDDLRGVNPQLAEMAASGNPEAVYEAYKLLATMTEGRPRMNTPARQLELPLSAEDEIRSLIPYGSRGPGAPGALSGPGQLLDRQLDMIPAPLLGLPAPGQRRLGTTAGVPVGALVGGPQRPFIDVPFERVPPRRPAASRSPEAPRTDTTPARTQPGGSPLGKAAVAAGAGVAAYNLLPKKTEPETNADLVEETRPAPKVSVEEPKPSVVQGPPDYAAQARALIARANDIQRAEGRQTPESLALIKESDRLYQLAAEGRSKGTQPAIMPVEQQNAQTSSIQRNAREQIAQNQDGGYRTQARRKLAELNMRSSQGNISPAEYAQKKAEIDRLFALADQQDNQPKRTPRPGMGRTQFPRAKEKPFQLIPNTRGLRSRSGTSTT